MATDRWDQIEEVFAEALDRSPSEQAKLLRERCGHDKRLLHLLESLLANDLMAEGVFLEPSGSDAHPARNSVDADELVDKKLGAYTIQRVLARGGMGTVYLAEQENPRRLVALKVLHPSPWTHSAQRRFDVESRILAYLQHPNVAQIYESGSCRLETGPTVHYFAMERVPEARTITRYASETARSVTDRLNLFLQLCDAVQHGHQKGIVHRDLKPANVLVDKEGRVKVIDFGIARTMDSDIAATTIHTEAGQILGTLAYMSPEQCAADPSQIDTTTDIYSLGVILFELLTGRMPYDVSNMTIHSAARVICEKEPSRPSEYNRKLRGDAETIILKAIRKDRATRYQSVGDLGNDIRHLLSGEPISARPPTAYSRMLRWAARHAVATTALLCALVGVFILAAAGVAWWAVVQRADRVEVEDDGRRVVVYSWGNRPLHTWATGEQGGHLCGTTVDRPSVYGGGRIAMIGFDANPHSPLSGGLHAFDINGPYDKPLWSAHLADADLPDGLRSRGHSGEIFGTFFISHFDVFPDDPGEEIVTTFVCHLSHRALCIYSTAGTLLYRVWQDGGIHSVYWMKDAGLLICAGGDEAIKTRSQPSRNLDALFCNVVFAVKPVKGNIQNGYLKPDATDPLLKPEWYKYLWPLGSKSISVRQDLLAPRRTQDCGKLARLAIEFNGRPGAGLEFTIDQFGREAWSSRILGDDYNADQAQPATRRKLPPADVFQLQDKPPTDSWPPQAADRR